MAETHLLTPAAAAAYCGVSKSTLFRATAAGRVKRVRLGPQTIRYEVEELDRWIRKSRGQ
jgi:excisionase family DNA binding protein